MTRLALAAASITIAVHLAGAAAGRQAGTAPERAPKAEQGFAIVNGTIIDGTGREPIPDGVVVVRGTSIVSVGRRAVIGVPNGATVVDARGGTILPGIINAHVHDAFRAKNLEAWAMAGVTTVRDEGIKREGPLSEFLRLRRQFAAQPNLARLVTAGRMIAPPGGYGELFVRSAAEAARAVEDEAAQGVDQIKFSLEDGYGPRGDLPVLPADAAAAVVAAAHARGKRVSAHVTEAAFLKQAMEAGADDLAHIVWDAVDDRVIAALAARGVPVTPTISVFDAYGAGEGAVANLRRFARAGVTIALGTDYTDVPQNNFPHFELGMTLYEMRRMADAGMTPMAILVAATRNSARACGLDRELGTLEAGKTADILVVAGNPLADIATLARVRAVVHNGAIIRHEMTGPRTLAEAIASDGPTRVREAPRSASGARPVRSGSRRLDPAGPQRLSRVTMPASTQWICGDPPLGVLVKNSAVPSDDGVTKYARMLVSASLSLTGLPQRPPKPSPRPTGPAAAGSAVAAAGPDR
jgi:imidazolonepropionase-like amidohydrolase